jgi:hypothetical protein
LDERCQVGHRQEGDVFILLRPLDRRFRVKTNFAALVVAALAIADFLRRRGMEDNGRRHVVADGHLPQHFVLLPVPLHRLGHLGLLRLGQIDPRDPSRLLEHFNGHWPLGRPRRDRPLKDR